MFCPHCGHSISEQDAFCKNCGAKMTSQDVLPPKYPSAFDNGNNTLAISLLSVGAGIALLISLISILLYEKVYFFDGYTITKVAWIVAIGSVILGVILLGKNILDCGIHSYYQNYQKQLISAVILIAVIPGIMFFSYIKDDKNQLPSTSESNNDYNSPEYIQGTYESCHSTYQHKQALYSYDLNNDNSISAYEMELFMDAHPKIGNDRQFMSWAESLVN